MSNTEDKQGVQPQQENAQGVSQAPADKGKGKAVDRNQDADMGDDDEDDSSEEESAAEEVEAEEDDEEEDEGMEEIDTENIIGGGRRTRGKNIDWAKAAEQIEDDEDDEDEEDDGDFEDPDESMQG